MTGRGSVDAAQGVQVRRYLTRKVITYILAFFVGATIDWASRT